MRQPLWRLSLSYLLRRYYMDKKSMLLFSPSLVFILILILYPRALSLRMSSLSISGLLLGLTFLQIKYQWKHLLITIIKYLIIMFLLLFLTFNVLLYAPNLGIDIPYLIVLGLRGVMVLLLLLFTFSQPVFIVYEYQYFLNNEKR